MKILLMIPPVGVLYGTYKDLAPSRPPLGIAYIAAVLEKNNYKVKIFDGGIYTTEEELINELNEYNPDIVGMSITSLTIKEALRSAKKIKELNKNIKIILGGPHISIDALNSMKYEEFDISVIGEGEEAFLEIVRYYENDGNIDDIKGIFYRNDGKIIQTKDREPIKNLDDLPYPARHLLPSPNKYKQTPFKNTRFPQTSMVSSRGCPYNCIFCSQYPFKHMFRFHSAKYVIAELEHLIKDYGIKEVAFQDDVFTLKKDRVIEICNEIINKKLDITWSCWARVTMVDKELLELMKKAGCIAISYGIEAADDETLKKIKKNITIQQIQDAVKATNEAGIYCIGHFILGYPFDTREIMKIRLDFAKSLPLDGATFSTLIPFPGSEVYETAKTQFGEYDQTFIYNETKYGSHNKPVYSPPGLTIKDMEEIRDKYYKSFYVRPKFIFRRLVRLKSFGELKTLYNAGKSLIKV